MRPHRWILAVALVLAPAFARAQVETDGSLGPAGLVPGGTLPDGSLATYRIDESLGQRRGANLFQSFSRFNVGRGESAVFTADLPTERVLARVTSSGLPSGAPSVISGTLRSTIPGADLYLMNPYGVIFGAGASLDLPGSLHVSTADALHFSDGTTFSALPNPAGEILSAAAPSAWGFIGDDVGIARFTLDRALAVSPGRTISVAAGAISLRGTAGVAALQAPGGEIALGARATPGLLPVDLGSFDARAAAPGELGSVLVGPNLALDVSDAAGDAAERGRIVIRGGQLALDRATLSSGSAAAAPEGFRDIDLEASESIDLGLRTVVSATALGGTRGGRLRLSAPDVFLHDQALAETRAFGGADAGDVEVDGDRVRLASAARLGSTTQIDGGRGGGISIRGGTLDITDGAQVSGTTLGAGAAGDVDVEMSESVRLAGIAPTGPSGLFARSGLGFGTDATGAGGEIRVVAPRVSVEDGAEISAQSFGSGPGGAVRIEASDTVRLGSAVLQSASINSLATDGRGGDIAIETGALALADGGIVSATTLGTARAGNVVVTAPQLAVGGAGPLGSGLFAQSLLEDAAGGDGGDIELRVSDSVDVLTGGQISVSTLGSGNAGQIRFDGTDRVRVAGGTVSAVSQGAGRGGIVRMDVGQLDLQGGSVTTEARGQGAGGEIVVDARGDVTLTDGAALGATTTRTGNAGNVTVSAGGEISILGASRVATQTTQDGEGGNAGTIALAARVVRVAEDAAVTSSTSSSGNAGTIAISGDRVRLESGGRVASDTSALDGEILSAGNGGSIDVRAKGTVSLATSSAISAASSGDGDAGSVLIVAGRLTVGSGASITSQTARGGVGGDVSLTAARGIELSSGGQVSASSGGAGDAGTISIDAGDELRLRDGGRITTQADTAFGGNIDIRARELVYVENGEITTSVNAGAGNGGNITIDPKFVVLNGGRIEARANAGNGGNIVIRADQFLADVHSSVDASSALGIDGQVVITSPDTNLTGELAQLATDYLDPSSQLSRACAARSGGQGTFQVVGGARPSAPDAPLESGGAERQPGCPEPSR